MLKCNIHTNYTHEPTWLLYKLYFCPAVVIATESNINYTNPVLIFNIITLLPVKNKMRLICSSYPVDSTP